MNDKAPCPHVDVVSFPDYTWHCAKCGERFFPSEYDQRRARLLDEFAMAALIAILPAETINTPAGAIAAWSYDQAEAMLAEKEKHQCQPTKAS